MYWYLFIFMSCLSLNVWIISSLSKVFCIASILESIFSQASLFSAWYPSNFQIHVSTFRVTASKSVESCVCLLSQMFIFVCNESMDWLQCNAFLPMALICSLIWANFLFEADKSLLFRLFISGNILSKDVLTSLIRSTRMTPLCVRYYQLIEVLSSKFGYVPLLYLLEIRFVRQVSGLDIFVYLSYILGRFGKCHFLYQNPQCKIFWISCGYDLRWIGGLCIICI